MTSDPQGHVLHSSDCVRYKLLIGLLGGRNAHRCLCFHSDDASEGLAKAATRGNDLNTQKRPETVQSAAERERVPKKGNAQAVSTGGDGINPVLTAELKPHSGPYGQSVFQIEGFIRFRKWNKPRDRFPFRELSARCA